MAVERQAVHAGRCPTLQSSRPRARIRSLAAAHRDVRRRRMTRRHLRSTLLALVLLAGLGCSGPTRGLKDPSKMKGVVLKAVPVGSRIEEARRFMEREGFRCSPQTKSSFADHDGTRKGIDYLYCD